MNLAVQHLKAIGCQASGIISDHELKAVSAETHVDDYDEVILATRRQGATRLARGLHPGPVHSCGGAGGQRLVTFAAGTGTKPKR